MTFDKAPRNSLAAVVIGSSFVYQGVEISTCQRNNKGINVGFSVIDPIQQENPTGRYEKCLTTPKIWVKVWLKGFSYNLMLLTLFYVDSCMISQNNPTRYYIFQSNFDIDFTSGTADLITC